MRCGGSRNARTGVDRVKPLKFDESTSWTVFHHQFKAVAGHTEWTSREKVMHLFAILQG
jgi:hypothetical protein